MDSEKIILDLVANQKANSFSQINSIKPWHTTFLTHVTTFPPDELKTGMNAESQI
jgi:hypothetical protein